MRPFGLLYLLILLLSACAQVADISGGERDTDPPLLVVADPPHLTTNFTGDRITLSFNERVQLDRVRDRLLISPPLTSTPEVRLTGPRTVTIGLTAPLSPNTTYSFSIGEAIRDLTEGNIAAGLVHVISTGSFVDSSMIAGKVTNAFTGQPESGVLVVVHQVGDTGSVRTSRPAFATRTNGSGDLLLDHLRDGEYRLYALRDQNANYRFDLPNEEIAFLDDPVRALRPSDSLQVHQLRLFKEVGSKQQVRETQVTADGALQLILNRPAKSITIEDVARTGGTLQWLTEWVPTRDTVLLWPSDTTALQAGRYRITAEEEVIDTIGYRRRQAMPFFTGLMVELMDGSDSGMISISASRPIATIDTSLFEIMHEDKAIDHSLSRDPTSPRKIRIEASILPGDEVLLLIRPGAITDIYGGRNDTLRAPLGRAAEESTGSVRIKLKVEDGSTGPFIIQLLDPQGRVLLEGPITGPGEEIVWDRLPPGKARLRLIGDSNGNGRWDTGDLDRGVQPEMVWHHPDVLNIRAAWDIGIEWRIGEKVAVGVKQP